MMAHRLRLFSTCILIAGLLAFTSLTLDHSYAQDNPPESTAEPTAEVTSEPTAEVTAEPTAEVTVEPTEEITAEPTAEVTAESTAEPTAEATQEAPPEMGEAPMMEMMAMAAAAVTPPPSQSFCQMDIGTQGDNDPFTYTFSAINVVNIAGYDWTIDGSPVATSQSFNYAFNTTGTHNIVLNCTDSNSNILTVNGSITITAVPNANFSVFPASGFAPLSVQTFNTSTGGGLSYLWEVVSFPVGAGPFPNSTGTDTSYSFTLPGLYTIRLTATNGAGMSSVFEQQVAVNALPPSADFTLVPSTGTAPLNVTMNGIINAGSGQIDSWSWDFEYDGSTFTEDATGQGPHNYAFTVDGTYTIRMNYSGPGGNGWVQKQVLVSPSGQALVADFVEDSRNNVPGGVQICFRNLSTGPIARNLWNFGDGSPIIEDNAAVVCHTFTTDGNYTVRLRVEDLGNTASAEAQRTMTVVAAPIASFNASTTNLTWGQTVNFTDTSTGVITTWEWDFNGDGTIDSTDQHPSGILVGNIGGAIQLGPNPVQLRVTGPGGTSTSEMIIVVNRLELTCLINGPTSVVPGAGAQNFTSTIGQTNGRTVTYNWTVTGGALNQSYNTANISQAFPAEGTYLLTLNASTADGASCSDVHTVTVTYPPLACSMTGPTAALPNGSNNTYTANVSGIAGRTMTYDWYVDGNLAQSGPSNAFNRSWTTNNVTEVISYIATASNGANCGDSRTVTVSWPTLTCSITGGSNTPRPNMPSDPGGVLTHTYNSSVSGASGRPLTYSWTVTRVSDGSTYATGSGTSIQLNWDWTLIGEGYDINLTVTAENGASDPLDANCNASSRRVTVTMPALTCNLPTGDTTPVVGETVSFGRNLSNAFGRPWANGTSAASTLWDFERWNGSAWIAVSVDQTGDTYPFTFTTPGERYRVRYSASVLNPSANCTSGWQVINVAGTGNNFTCDAWNGGDTTPDLPSGNYPYSVMMDNTNAIDLQYRWVLIDAAGVERDLAITTSTADNVINSPAFSGALLGPIGDYTLRVYVTPVNPADSTHNCSLQTTLNVGSFNVNYTYTGNNNAIEVGQQVCFTNTSATSHDGINGLNYTWDFGTANNSLGSQTSTAQQPGCLSFGAQGTYVVRLTGMTNISGLRTATYQVTFRVWNSQSIVINRTDSAVFAGNTVSFNATGVNINSYSWNIYDAVSGTRIGPANRSGTSISQFIANPGQYRVVVDGTGPLGVTTAEYTFQLLGIDDILAAFTPSRYAGIAPLDVCFTDNSQGNNLRTWTWDFGNGQTLTYTNTTIPGSVCTSYTQAGQSYSVRLTVTNAAGASASATNIIRTYSALEAASNFSITPVSSSRYCYTAILPGGVSVTGWAFGDGQTGGATSPICHDYGSAGTYIVTMSISNASGQTGSVTRTITVTPSGGAAPNLQVQASCSADRTATFTVTNSGGAMTTPDEVIFRDNTGAIIRLDTLQVGAGGTQTFTLTNMSGVVTFETVDWQLSANTTCEYPPQISVAPVCNGMQGFQISNADGPMITPQNYEIRDAGNNVVSTGSFQLARGAAPVIVNLPNGADPYAQYTFVSNGSAGNFNVLHDCGPRPVIQVVSICQSMSAFTIANTGRDMLIPQNYEVRDASNNVVISGSFQLNNGAPAITVTLPNGVDPYAVYTFVSNGPAGNLNVTHDCTNPAVQVTLVCQSMDAFTIANTGGNMLIPQDYEVRDAGGNAVVTGSFQLNNSGAPLTVTLPNGVNPYAAYTFVSNGPAGNLNVTHDCGDPILRMSSICEEGNPFTISNVGAEMLIPQRFTLLTEAGYDITPASNTFMLTAGSSVSIALDPATRIYDMQHRLFTTGFAGDVSVTLVRCQRPVTLSAALDITPTPEPEGLGIDGVGVPDWDSVQICGHGCPTFRLYHTDETGDWEIFRLDGANEEERTSIRQNLSLGEGEGVDDMAPSLSPNDEWIVFTSNRDSVEGQLDNWELYVAPTSGGNPDAVRRVTFNETAIDTDPVWGPNNFVVFETNRNGNWDLYAVDMSTGQEYQLTSDPADDINPYWSPDGSKLVFQSARDGQWQIYEYSMGSATQRRLSDGTSIDVEPEYSADGSRIAFRTYDEEGEHSVIAIMSANGSGREIITTPEEDATNHVWSPDDAFIAYQSDKDGDLDVYVYEVGTGRTRQLTDNTIPDYAPTWRCSGDIVVFTSDIAGNPDIYEANVTPIPAPGIAVDEEADQLTFEQFNDIYPQNAPPEENASREGQTALGDFGQQTIFLKPDVDETTVDVSIDGITRKDWQEINSCPADS